MLAAVGVILGVLVAVGSALSLTRGKSWWVRVWDFPRLQIAVLGLVALACLAASLPWSSGWRLTLGALVAVAVCYQLALVWRYTRLAPREVQRSAHHDPARRLSIVVANVLQTNRESDRLLAAVRDADADVVLCVETDRWWMERLDALRATHPHVVQCPLDNTYGMLLYSRLPIGQSSTDFLVEPDVPSIQAVVRLRGGQEVWLNCVHPRPPAPGESDESLERDAELLVVGQRVHDSVLPVVVCGDLNDVAWSHTTRLFQKTSGLVDPRKGRGFFSTFPARWPGLRFPLDHVFISTDFRLVSMRRLPYVGSDHFPMHAILSHEPQADAEQSAPEADGGDRREVRETMAEARGGDGRAPVSGPAVVRTAS